MVALATGQAVRDAILGVYLPDGKLRWIAINARPIFEDGSAKPVSVICTLSDITDRRQHEDEARLSSNLLRGAIEAIDEAFVVYDPQDRLLLCNEQYRKVYALSADLLVSGASFEYIIRTGAERGQYAQAVGRVDEWVAQRLAAHRFRQCNLSAAFRKRAHGTNCGAKDARRTYSRIPL
jgi:PAS domain-containing protein